MKKRLLASLMALCLLVGLFPTAAMAAGIEDEGLCPHHTEHTAECGYAAPTEGTPCTHVHTEACYSDGILPTDGEEKPADACAHVHDAECGYSEGIEGSPCNFVCNVCPVEAMIEALPAYADATPDDVADIEKAQATYNALGEEQATVDSDLAAKLAALSELAVLLADAQNTIDVEPLTDDAMSGTCGAEGNESNVTWALTANSGDPTTYTLTISGTGAMADYGNATGQPWNSSAGSITEVEIDNRITHIGGNVFRNFTQLTEVNIPDGVTSLGNMVFGGCSSLTEVSLPDTITTLGNNVFQASGIAEMVLPEGITEIGQQVFHTCTSLKKVVFPSSLNSLGVRACYGATSLEEVIFLGELSEIPEQAFENCSSLKSVSWPKNLSTIGDTAFQGSGVENITIPEGVQTIGNTVFRNCTSLKNVALPKTLTSIGENSFRGCTSLTSIVIPEKVTSIGAQAFNGDTGLKSVVILGDSVTVGNNVFSGIEFPIIYCKTITTTIPANSATKIIVAYTDGGVFETAPTSSDSLSDPIKDGYRFAGWYNNTEFTGDQVTQITKTEGKNFSKYYAKWEKSSYTVPDELAFVDATYGENIEAQTIAVSLNSGEAPGSGGCTAESSDTSVFTVSDYDSSNGTFTVTPVSGLGAGTYEETIRVTTPDGATHDVAVSLTISRATPSISISASDTALTGGGAVTLTVNGLPDGASATMTASPSVTISGSGYTFTATLPNSTVDYTFTAEYAGDDNHNGATATCTVSVTRRSSSSSSSGSTTYTVSVDDTDNGDVTVSPRQAERGETVTITIDPDEGYELDELTVTDSDGDEIDVEQESSTEYTFVMPRGRVTVEATFVRTGESTFFTDVPESFWAYDEIKWAYDNGYVNGTSDTTFSPNSSISRQQVWMILARLSGADPASMAEARQWAMENGISDGTTPGNAVTRQQLVALLFRYATMMGYANDARADLNSYPDAGTVASYAVEPMQWSVANSIVAGTSDGTLNPTGTATRAQFAVILYRFWNQIG